MALLREFLRKKQGIANPSAALLKALLIAGAKRLPGTAPSTALVDNHQGFGRVNVDRSVKRALATLEGPALKTGNKSTFTVKVPTASNTLRIVLCYSDFPGSSLINNLNLFVTDPAGKRYVGNQPSSAGGTLTLDSTNNVEVVQVGKAKKGSWTLDVVASNVSSGPQDFALADVHGHGLHGFMLVVEDRDLVDLHAVDGNGRGADPSTGSVRRAIASCWSRNLTPSATIRSSSLSILAI